MVAHGIFGKPGEAPEESLEKLKRSLFPTFLEIAPAGQDETMSSLLRKTVMPWGHE
jgi:hypothetical protein